MQDLAHSLNPSNPLMEATAYALKHWNALTRFLDNPQIDIDNNASEREIKDFVLARKNFLFAGSDRGGKAAAIHMSLIASCKRVGINPVEYLTDVFTRINSLKTSELHQLLPDRWSEQQKQKTSRFTSLGNHPAALIATRVASDGHLTIAFSMAISSFNALTLTPALSALWLKDHQETHSVIFRSFNNGLDALRRGFRKSLAITLRWRMVAVVLFGLSLLATWWLFKSLPSAFIPDEDSGWFVTLVQAPEGVSLSYTSAALKKVEEQLAKVPEIESDFGIAGFSFTGTNANNGIVFANMKPWHQRQGQAHSLNSVIDRLRGPLSSITEASVIPFNPPAIQGLGNFGGFVFELEDLTGGNVQDLAAATQELCRKANQLPELRGVFSSFNASTPQLVVDVDRDKAKSLQVDIGDVFRTLQAYLGSEYVNDFDMSNRVYRVYVQADQQYRSNPADIGAFYVRNSRGQMISLSNLVSVKRTVAAQTISHYNLFRNAEINGSAAPGFSSGQAMHAMESLASKVLPAGMSYEWSGISLEEIEAGGSAIVLFALGLVFVFLVLAAQYESFSDPLIILFSVPLAMLGALLAQYLRGLQNDVFCQIGLVMLIGLASKNAILIVEFANKLQESGLNPVQAVLRAAEIRLRPILMTSLAFVFGILPLVFASGAGAGARHSLGTAVCGGMVVSTVLSVFVVPVIYVTIASLRPRQARPPEELQPYENGDGAPDQLPFVGSDNAASKRQ